jgi:hypothetical protein
MVVKGSVPGHSKTGAEPLEGKTAGFTSPARSCACGASDIGDFLSLLSHGKVERVRF